jgi:hypothetical protein
MCKVPELGIKGKKVMLATIFGSGIKAHMSEAVGSTPEAHGSTSVSGQIAQARGI